MRDLAVVPTRAFLVACIVQRIKHSGGELRGFLEDCIAPCPGSRPRSPAASPTSRQAGQLVHARTACLSAGPGSALMVSLSRRVRARSDANARSRHPARHQRRHRLEQSPRAVVGDLEDRRFRVLVDRDDDLRLSFMPARCWIAPEMPTAMYSCGATILPVWPTCQSFGTKPASTAAREAPIAAPSLSASGSSTFVKFSPEPMPRPPETMIFAAVSSGRSDFDTSRLTNCEMPASAARVTAFDWRRCRRSRRRDRSRSCAR